MTNQLIDEIGLLQRHKCRLQLCVERCNIWWKNISKWKVLITNSFTSPTSSNLYMTSSARVTFVITASSGAASNLHYCVTIHVTDESLKSGDDVTGWSVERSLKDFYELHEQLKEVWWRHRFSRSYLQFSVQWLGEAMESSKDSNFQISRIQPKIFE